MPEGSPRKKAKVAVETQKSVDVFGDVLLGNIKADEALIWSFLDEHAWDGKTVKIGNDKFFPLLLAIGKKNHDLATILIEECSADPTAFPGVFEPVLTIACSTNETDAQEDENLAKLLLSRGADPQYQGTDNMTALHICASVGASTMASTLAYAMKDVNPRDSMGKTPLHYALVNQQNEDLVKVLLDRGADPNLPSGDGLLPLFMASVHSHLSYTKILVDFGAKTELRNERGMTALAMAKTPQQALVLLEVGCRGDFQDRSGVCPLHTHFRLWDGDKRIATCALIADSFVPVLDRLITQSSNLNPVDNLGRSPLHRACEVSTPCALYFIKKMLDGGAVMDIQDKLGWTPLHTAVAGGNLEAVKLLVGSSADVERRDMQGRTTLHLVGLHALAEQSKGPEQDSRSRLLAFGSAGMMSTTDYGDSFPFITNGSCHGCSRHDSMHEKISSLLLNAGANILAMDREGSLPFSFACQAHCDTSVYVMLRRAAEAGLFPLGIKVH